MKILVTGANKGIGFGIVKHLMEFFPNTFVYLGCRDEEKGREAVNALVNEVDNWARRLCHLVVDVSDLESVKYAASQIKKDCAEDNSLLSGIVNNAGIARSPDGVVPILEVNTFGPKRVFDEFLPLLESAQGRLVNVTSASGPNYLFRCEERIRSTLTDPNVNWEEISSLIDGYIAGYKNAKNDEKIRFYEDAYGFSKACTNALTIFLARSHPNLIINSCTPGFIETDLTKPFATEHGKTPQEMGMKTPSEGAASSIYLLTEEIVGTGFYYGSDCVRSPLDCYRSPGDPPYQGD